AIDESDGSYEDIGKKIMKIIGRIPLKDVYWHNSDIRNVEGIKEEGLRRSYSLNQYLHGCLLDMSGEHKFFRSEEHTSELQSRFDLVCRLLLEKKKTSITAQP